MKIDLRRWRERRALTQRELAAKAGVTPRTVTRIELGYDARPTTVRRLAAALEISTERLVGSGRE